MGIGPHSSLDFYFIGFLLRKYRARVCTRNKSKHRAQIKIIDETLVGCLCWLSIVVERSLFIAEGRSAINKPRSIGHSFRRYLAYYLAYNLYLTADLA